MCPNGTAFDQEAQTCADFGDVDCEQATLYYGSDNFDLYRIGSGYDRKRTSNAVGEEETTFHLQRAESSKFFFLFSYKFVFCCFHPIFKLEFKLIKRYEVKKKIKKQSEHG